MMPRPDTAETDPPRPRPVRWLLAVPVVAVLWVPFYNRVEPSVFGVPFFYWYQLLWVLLGALIIGLVYRSETR